MKVKVPPELEACRVTWGERGSTSIFPVVKASPSLLVILLIGSREERALARKYEGVTYHLLPKSNKEKGR